MVEVRTANQLEDLKELLKSGGEISIAVAYVTKPGLGLIKDELEAAIEKGKEKEKVRLLIALDGRTTTPEAVQELLELQEKGLSLKYFDIPRSKPKIFHPKLFIACTSETTTFLTGSYNLTEAALCRNKEHGVRISCGNSEKEGQEALEAFDKLWSHKWAKCLTQKVADNYKQVYKRRGIVPSHEELPNRNYWLLKCDPGRFTFDEMWSIVDRTEPWGENIVHPLAVKYLKRMKLGDKVVIYHQYPMKLSGEGRVKVRMNRAEIEASFRSRNLLLTRWPSFSAVVGTGEIVEEAEWRAEPVNRWIVRVRANSRLLNGSSLTECKDIMTDCGVKAPGFQVPIWKLSDEVYRRICDAG